ncbi:MAG TPA: tryptophan--tRNA ligase [Micromonosporaceae bacterium]|jgi:tryptophanyl-tRNA synthetase|nr:tryptophan--tRNA ligase [Micromonosporaceae bacterium]
MSRLSGFKPTGHLQLGNYLGAIRPMVASQDRTECVVMIVDLHALTVEHDPVRLPALTREITTVLLAAGVDPDRSTFYLQSHVPEHTELHYLLECATGYGEARRMVQFKERVAGRQRVRLSLLTYPVLMAGDILLHDTDEVPVGADQSQHLELARDIAIRFNARYGATFVVPRAVKPVVAGRVMDLDDPLAKMGKSNAVTSGTLFLLDPPDTVRRKVLRAVTDPESEVRYDPAAKPGVSNLLEILAACAGGSPAALAPGLRSYAELKAAVADAVIATIEPIQRGYAELASDPARVDSILRTGADRAAARAARTVRRARTAMGLLPARAGQLTG